MIILSHRGYWKLPSEKNSLKAFERSFKLGFGTETDLRDYNSKLVISHDMAIDTSMCFRDFLDVYKNFGSDLPLAINIKSDGLQEELDKQLREYEVENYFVFDMSVPDGVKYIDQGMEAFTRQSEYERYPSYYQEAKGVWMDEFHSDWIENNYIAKHLDNSKSVCIVSPELHGREPKQRWSEFKNWLTFTSDNVILCTDYPEKARDFFVCQK